MEQAASPSDHTHLRAAFSAALDAARAGNRPFGAVIVGAGGDVLVRAGSTQGQDHDTTAHAEMNAVRMAMRQRIARPALLEATLYASSEPCAMCAAAIFYSGIGRVVFGLSEPRLRALRSVNEATAGLALSCRDILQHAPRPLAIVGPLLEEEALAVHTGYWTESAL